MTSLRARLLVVLLLLVTGGLVAADVATYTLLRSSLVDRVDQQYEALLGPIGRIANDPNPRSVANQAEVFRGLIPPGGAYEVRETTGAPFRFVAPRGDDTGRPPALPDKLPNVADLGDAAPKAFLTKAPNGDEFRSYALRLDDLGTTLTVSLPLRDVYATLHRLLGIEVVITSLALLVAAALGWWLVRVGLRPLRVVSATADAIAAGDLSRRVERADSKTEVGRLGLAFNEMLTRIEASFEEQRASEARLRQFVADASHELRTPLTSVRGYAELFRHGAESRPEDLAKTMARIEEEAARMGVLVDDLLLLARLDQGRPLDEQPVDLAALATAAVDRARIIEPDRDLELQVHGDAHVIGDAARLQQVLDNLLLNVRTHTPPRARAWVRVGTFGDHAALAVTDTGRGLTPEEQDHVFERFYRVDESRTRDRGGSGLGLSIVRSIVEAHGGTVAVESVPGHGSTFQVMLPLAPESDAVPEPHEWSPSATDDDPADDAVASDAS